MTKEAQRIAIAEACPTVLGRASYVPVAVAIDRLKRNPWPVQAAWLWECVPDYLSDLDAIHEVEKVLTKEQWWKYFEHLQDVMEEIVVQNVIRATAVQRAEAFLRTLNLWDDSK